MVRINKSLEHDREVIPHGHDSGSAEALREDVGHAESEGRSASGAVEKSLLADGVSEAPACRQRSQEIPSLRSSLSRLRQSVRRRLPGC